LPAPHAPPSPLRLAPPADAEGWSVFVANLPRGHDAIGVPEDFAGWPIMDRASLLEAIIAVAPRPIARTIRASGSTVMATRS